MWHDQLFQDMLELNSYELLGKESLQKYGEPFNYVQYIYAVHHAHSISTLAEIMTPSAVAQQRELRQKFQKQFADALTEEYFLPGDRDMEIEQLLRFVDIPTHKHNFVECAFVLNGTCIHMIGNYPYTHEAGGCAMIPSWVEHHLQPSPDCVCLTVKVRQSTFNQMSIPNLPLFVHPLGFQCGQDDFVYHTVLSIYEQQESRKPYSEQVMKQMFQVLLTYIMQNYRDTLQYLLARAINNGQMLEILNYSFENYQTITLHALANHFHFNPSYLSNYIHQQTGQTFTDMLKEIKLKQTAKLLLETKMPLNDICGAVGYKDTSQFIRNFKEVYGTTPIRYRRENRTAK